MFKFDFARGCWILIDLFFFSVYLFPLNFLNSVQINANPFNINLFLISMNFIKLHIQLYIIISDKVYQKIICNELCILLWSLKQMYQNYKIMKTQDKMFYFKRNWRYIDTMPKPDSKIYCIIIILLKIKHGKNAKNRMVGS